jgi:phosphatidylglycerol:prolipoprotein diacylglycerol transferase
MSALPYVELTRIGPVQSFGLLALAGFGLGVLTTVLLGRKRGVPGRDLGLIVPIAAAAVMFGSHWFDVAWYRWDDASQDPKLWLRLYQGVSVFGGVFAAAFAVWALARTRSVDLAVWADIAAIGMLVGLTIGRVACALVHDHPGVATDLPIGIDFPTDRLYFTGARDLGSGTVRLHDVGFEELLLLIPLTIAAFVLIARPLRAGTVAAVIAIAYVGIRFPLDFLRMPETEPTRLGLTGGQWGCVVLLALTVLAIVLRRSRPQS